MPGSLVFVRAGRLDRGLFARVAAGRGPWLDVVLPRLSRAADHALLWHGTAGVLALAGGEDGRRAAVRGVGSLAVTSAIVNLAIKRAVRRPRPELRVVPRGRRLTVQPLTTSFPSGHAASAAAFAVAVGGERPALAPVLGVAGAAVAYSRVYVGVHYPGDVVAGVAVGAGVALAARRLLARRPAREEVD